MTKHKCNVCNKLWKHEPIEVCSGSLMQACPNCRPPDPAYVWEWVDEFAEWVDEVRNAETSRQMLPD